MLPIYRYSTLSKSVMTKQVKMLNHIYGASCDYQYMMNAMPELTKRCTTNRPISDGMKQKESPKINIEHVKTDGDRHGACEECGGPLHLPRAPKNKQKDPGKVTNKIPGLGDNKNTRVFSCSATGKLKGFFKNMLEYLQLFLIYGFSSLVVSDPHASLTFDYPNLKDEIYDQPVNMMNKKAPHAKNEPAELQGDPGLESWPPFDFSKFDEYINDFKQDSSPEHNRIKRHARKRRGRGGKRRNRNRSSTPQPEDDMKNGTSTEVPIARKGKDKGRKKGKGSSRAQQNDIYEPGQKDWEGGYVEMPKDLYQAHLRPGVIFRIHMSEAVLKMQYRNYGEDKDESVIEADVEYLRLTRKVINDEITKFEDLKWLIGWFHNRSDLIQEHMCNTRYFAIGTPPTMFTHPEEYMKRLCLFDSVYIDHIPYVVGEDSSLMAAVAPPVLHCDAATCTSVPFIDSVMFEERLSRTNVRTLTRCQASCRAHCRNDPDCLKRCSDRCLRTD